MKPRAASGKRGNWDLQVLEASNQLVRHLLEERGNTEAASSFLAVALLVLEKLNGGEPSFWENPCATRLYLALRRVARKGILDPQIVGALMDEGNHDSSDQRASRRFPRDLLILYAGSPAVMSRVSRLGRTCGKNR